MRANRVLSWAAAEALPVDNQPRAFAFGRVERPVPVPVEGVADELDGDIALSVLDGLNVVSAMLVLLAVSPADSQLLTPDARTGERDRNARALSALAGRVVEASC